MGAARAIGVCAGLVGCAGVALAAAASHALASRLDAEDMRRVWIAAGIALVHAPALLAIARGAPPSRPLAIAGAMLALGTLLFSGSLAARALCGWPSVLAPTGGVLLMLGWLVTGFFSARLTHDPGP